MFQASFALTLPLRSISQLGQNSELSTSHELSAPQSLSQSSVLDTAPEAAPTVDLTPRKTPISAWAAKAIDREQIEKYLFWKAAGGLQQNLDRLANNDLDVRWTTRTSSK